MKDLEVMAVRVEMPTNQPIVVLRERDGSRYLPIWVGAAEAAAIAYVQQGVVPPRPLTHDLMASMLSELDHGVTQVRITALNDGVFYAAIDIDGGDDGGTVVESRSSDAIALALRVGAPIVTTEELLDEAGIEMPEDEEEHEVEKFKEFLDSVSPEDFDTPQGDTP